MEGLIGYFLLGYLLGTIHIGMWHRILLYVGGVLGYMACLFGNLVTASSHEIPLPMDGGYMLNHYLLAASIFIFFRTFFEKRSAYLEKFSKPLELGSNLVFGVYWVHVLLLYILTALMGKDISLAPMIVFRIACTIPLSFLISAVINKIPVVNSILV